MIRTATCLAALAVLAVPAAFAETKTYDAQSFSAIKAEGAIDVIYERAATPSVTVEQAEGDFSDVYLDFDGDTLTVSRNSIRDKKGWFRGVSVNMGKDRKNIKVNGKHVPYYVVRVAGPTLDTAKVSSSAKLTAAGIEADGFTAKASSSGILQVSGNAQTARLDVSSSADLHAADLVAVTLSIDASSSGEVEARSTGTGHNSIDASSSADVTLVSAGAADFDIDASSSADVSLSGACATLVVSASSGADVMASDLACTSVDASGSSGADIDVRASESVKAHASSGADITVAGAPAQRDVSESSGGDVDIVS
ncbi:MAG TPA: DUF2807 domain-containing protein [Hyphomonas sp.]|mgnify:CR=1 FL=1|nr:DUF2807 domain-containing protein [Hyphomonas sp.]